MSLRFALAAAASVVAAVIGGAMPATAQPAPLRAGIFINPPFGGTPPGGYCFDLLNEIGARTGLTFEYFPMVVADLIAKVGTGETDIECSALGPTPERRALGVVFTGPIMTSRETILVAATDATAYVTLADFQGKRMGAGNGTANFTQLSNAGLNPIAFPSSNEGLAAILAGQLDGYMTNATEAPTILAAYPGIRAVETYRSTRVSYGFIGVKSGNVLLLGTVQNALEGMKADGTLARIAGVWGIPMPPF